MMTPLSFVFTTVIRAFFAFAPLIGFLNKEPKHFSLRGEELEEANELAATLNSRAIILSWAPLMLVALFTRTHELEKSIHPIAGLIAILAVIVWCIIGVKVKAKHLRPVWVPPLLFVFFTGVDAAFNFYYQDKIVGLIVI